MAGDSMQVFNLAAQQAGPTGSVMNFVSSGFNPGVVARQSISTMPNQQLIQPASMQPPGVQAAMLPMLQSPPMLGTIPVLGTPLQSQERAGQITTEIGDPDLSAVLSAYAGGQTAFPIMTDVGIVFADIGGFVRDWVDKLKIRPGASDSYWDERAFVANCCKMNPITPQCQEYAKWWCRNRARKGDEALCTGIMLGDCDVERPPPPPVRLPPEPESKKVALDPGDRRPWREPPPGLRSGSFDLLGLLGLKGKGIPEIGGGETGFKDSLVDTVPRLSKFWGGFFWKW